MEMAITTVLDCAKALMENDKSRISKLLHFAQICTLNRFNRLLFDDNGKLDDEWGMVEITGKNLDPLAYQILQIVNGIYVDGITDHDFIKEFNVWFDAKEASQQELNEELLKLFPNWK